MDSSMALSVFASWLSRQRKGEQFIYHVGLGIVNVESGIRNAIGDAAWKAYEDGLVLLTQRRTSKKIKNVYGTFEYIATRI